MLLCYSVTVLLCYYLTVLLCYCVTVLQCYSVTVLLCYCITVLLCYCATVSVCHSVTVLLYQCVTVLLYQCVTVSLCQCVTVLLCYGVSIRKIPNSFLRTPQRTQPVFLSLQVLTLCLDQILYICFLNVPAVQVNRVGFLKVYRQALTLILFHCVDQSQCSLDFSASL